MNKTISRLLFSALLQNILIGLKFWKPETTSTHYNEHLQVKRIEKEHKVFPVIEQIET